MKKIKIFFFITFSKNLVSAITRSKVFSEILLANALCLKSIFHFSKSLLLSAKTLELKKNRIKKKKFNFFHINHLNI